MFTGTFRNSRALFPKKVPNLANFRCSRAVSIGSRALFLENVHGHFWGSRAVFLFSVHGHFFEVHGEKKTLGDAIGKN